MSRSVLLAAPYSPKQGNIRRNNGNGKHGNGSIAGWVRPIKINLKLNLRNKLNQEKNRAIKGGIKEGKDENEDEDTEEEDDDEGWIDDRCYLRMIALGPMDLERKVKQNNDSTTKIMILMIIIMMTIIIQKIMMI